MTTFTAGVKDLARRLFGGYAELLRMPHTARFAIGSVMPACRSPWSA